MYAKEVTVVNPTGLHARPLSDFVSKASGYNSEIFASRPDDDTEYDCKSIIMMLSMGVCKGDVIKIEADGDDEQQAVDELVTFIENLEE